MKSFYLLCLLALLLPLNSLANLEKERQQRQEERREKLARETRERWEQERAKSNFKQSSFDSKIFMEEAGKWYDAIFVTEQPRDLFEGCVNAAKSTVIGALLGLSSLVGIPLITTPLYGFKGFIIGAIGGSIIGAISILIGLSKSLYHIVIGALHTPRALYSSLVGMRWDPEQREWAFYDLQKDSEELFSNNYTRLGNSEPLDLSFYELLGVQPDASAKEIKRAYYRKAKDVHPDKSKDTDAAEKFFKLHSAYQTLSDDDKRAMYDEWGASSSDSEQFDFDSRAFFAILFGSQCVETYTGELPVSSFVDQIIQLVRVAQTKGNFSRIWAETKNNPKKRQVEIAVNLLKRIEEYDSSLDNNDFRKRVNEEAEQIWETAFGEAFLTTIGYALRLESQMYLGYDMGMKAMVRKMLRRNISRLRLAQKVWKLAKSLPSLVTEDGKQDKKRTTDQQRLREMLPDAFEVALAYNVLDISSTLEGACWRLLGDTSASRSERRRRAEAMQHLADGFLHFAQTAKGDACEDKDATADDIEARLKVALNVAQMKKEKGMQKDSEEMIRSHQKSKKH
jgi:curved DNA-binding protein CbpA